MDQARHLARERGLHRVAQDGDAIGVQPLAVDHEHAAPAIARRVEQISRGVFKVNPGSLLTALKRLERAGWLDAEWRQSASSRRAKYYSLTKAGRKQLEVETEDWNRRATAIARLLRADA